MGIFQVQWSNSLWWAYASTWASEKDSQHLKKLLLGLRFDSDQGSVPGSASFFPGQTLSLPPSFPALSVSCSVSYSSYLQAKEANLVPLDQKKIY